MKMFKKIAATVMAAAMSLAMLTACGGGGGSTATQYKLAKVFANSAQTGKVYMELNTQGMTIVEATSKNGAYMRVDSMSWEIKTVSLLPSRWIRITLMRS